MRLTPTARLALTWFALVAVTLLAWWIGVRHGQGALQPNAAVSLGVVAIAAVKIRVILREFMEVRHAPVLLRGVTDAWLALMVAGVIAAYVL